MVSAFEVHQFLSELNDEFNQFVAYLARSVRNDFEVCHASFNYYYQKGKNYFQNYPIPIVTYKNVDIGFNLNEIFFEVFIEKDRIVNVDLSKLLECFDRVEIYGGENCELDFYHLDWTFDEVVNRVTSSNEKTIGISGYLDRIRTKISVEDVLEKHKSILAYITA